MKHLLTVVVATVAIGLLAGRGARLGTELMRDAKWDLLTRGTVIPAVTVVDTASNAVSLVDALLLDRANVLVILSAKCRSCLGELASWRDAVVGDRSLRPLAVIETDDPAYLDYVGRLIKPNYSIFLGNDSVLTALGARATPVTYIVDGDNRVAAAAIGVEATLRLREGWSAGKKTKSK
jgi:hypothetical protein